MVSRCARGPGAAALWRITVYASMLAQAMPLHNRRNSNACARGLDLPCRLHARHPRLAADAGVLPSAAIPPTLPCRA
ncbi:hypothetical protein CBM2615_B150120 [Cupriavidus taiwanensis]|uniref:Uncharacterized protein n=1 Tax=Cupriavidus taiwanensis TaxID=164546 RepID=A0A976G3T2_9BURK|nr:hypothetical protein CBM2614_B160124 [Cupriavidus taiwanensis]SOZ65158.1 hypothetical protein CBM2615_B150120 [Cupriavidus taiwanensis]SOZ68814.1 hypothetical protein CBM2613_B120120 [Cupriavidus taiwanensis]SPA08248.1 hypothetical protein CBM2625_B120119 [Cupriavidus taiwanensis]